MARYTIRTTVDITRANPDRADPDQVKQAQQSNFNSLIQGIGMRANITWSHDPIRLEENSQAVWSWEFEVESEGVFMKDEDPVALLKQDLHGIPIIKNLTNTIDFRQAIFSTHGEQQNIWIQPS